MTNLIKQVSSLWRWVLVIPTTLVLLGCVTINSERTQDQFIQLNSTCNVLSKKVAYMLDYKPISVEDFLLIEIHYKKVDGYCKDGTNINPYVALPQVEEALRIINKISHKYGY